MKAAGWAIAILILFCAAGLAWNREFRLCPGDRFGFYFWAGVGVFTALLTAGIITSE